MAGLNLNKKLWRIHSSRHGSGRLRRAGALSGCSGKTGRVVTVLSIFFGLAFITLVAYIILSFVLILCRKVSWMREDANQQRSPLNAVDEQLLTQGRSDCARWNVMSPPIPLR